MKEEIFYMVGIIGVGFLVNYALRARSEERRCRERVYA